MPCLSRRVPREILLSQLFHCHRTLAWPKQLRQTRTLFFLQHLPPFWPPSPTLSSKCCRPSKRQASRFLARRRAWPFLEAFLLRHHTQASLPLKRRRLLHLALVSQLLHRPWRPPWPQVGSVLGVCLGSGGSRSPCSRVPPFSKHRGEGFPLGRSRFQGCHGYLPFGLRHQFPSSSIGDEFKCG